MAPLRSVTPLPFSCSVYFNVIQDFLLVIVSILPFSCVNPCFFRYPFSESFRLLSSLEKDFVLQHLDTVASLVLLYTASLICHQPSRRCVCFTVLSVPAILRLFIENDVSDRIVQEIRLVE